MKLTVNVKFLTICTISYSALRPLFCLSFFWDVLILVMKPVRVFLDRLRPSSGPLVALQSLPKSIRAIGILIFNFFGIDFSNFQVFDR